MISGRETYKFKIELIISKALLTREIILVYRRPETTNQIHSDLLPFIYTCHSLPSVPQTSLALKKNKTPLAQLTWASPLTLHDPGRALWHVLVAVKGRGQRAFTLLYGGLGPPAGELKARDATAPTSPPGTGQAGSRREAEGSFSQIQGPHPAGRGVTDSHKPQPCLLVGWGSQSSAFAPPEEQGPPSRAAAMPTGDHTLIFPVRATPAPPSFAPHC